MEDYPDGCIAAVHTALTVHGAQPMMTEGLHAS
jgi:hypothetical protein